MDVVSCGGRHYELLPDVFYHLTTPGGLLFWNVRIREGLAPSTSLLSDESQLSGFTTSYNSCNPQPRKEHLWEEVRRVEFAHLPTRRKALFLFDCFDNARRAQQQWFPNESRHLLTARVVRTAVLHKADARWLEIPEHEWGLAARRYWSGELTDDPIVEVIIYGSVYFPDWREPPFGEPPAPR